MKRRQGEVNIFNMSMLDVISGAMGAFLLVMLVLVPYYGKAFREEDIQDVRNAIASAEDNLDRMEQALEQAQSDAERVEILESTLSQAQQDLQAAEKAQAVSMAALAQAVTQAQKEAKDAEEKLGLALEDHKLVFVIDVSRSMGPPEGTTPPFSTFENSIAEVSAGVKMLIATMDDTYLTDLVYFPNRTGNHPNTTTDQDYGYLWGELRGVTENRKYEAYQFLSELQPFSGTPTEAAMNYVLDNTGHRQANAIVLLSDGAPSNDQGQLEGQAIDRLVDRLTAKNNGRFKINTLGVGSSFRDQNVSSDAARFLKTLADRNDGFYIGF